MPTDDTPRGRTLEVERQFDAPDLAAVRIWITSQPSYAPLQLRPGGERQQLDSYLDTRDLDLYRARYTLRLRRVGEAVQATLKAFGTDDDGTRIRAEISQPLASATIDLFDAPGVVRERLLLMLGRRKPLRLLFTVHTVRQPFLLRRGERTLASIAIDETHVREDREATLLRRIEVEEECAGGLAQARSFVDAMQDACALAPATESKFMFGLRAAKVDLAASSNIGPLTADPEGRAGDYIYAALRRSFQKLRQHEAGARVHEDPEEVHQMRVATRELRALLSTFRAVLPVSLAEMSERFRDVAQRLGDVRDLDVRLEQMGAAQAAADWQRNAAINPLIGIIESTQQTALSRLRELLGAPEYEALIAACVAELRSRPVNAEELGRPVTALELGRRAIRRRYRQFRRDSKALGPESTASEYHAVRIRAKHLRYAFEPFASALPSGTRLRRALRLVQDLLGEYADAAGTIAWLESLVQERGYELPPMTLMVIGELAERNRTTITRVRSRWPGALRRVQRRWRVVRPRAADGRYIPGQATPQSAD